MSNAAWMLLFAAVPLLAQDGVKFDTPEVRVIEAVNSRDKEARCTSTMSIA